MRFHLVISVFLSELDKNFSNMIFIISALLLSLCFFIPVFFFIPIFLSKLEVMFAKNRLVISVFLSKLDFSNTFSLDVLSFD